VIVPVLYGSGTRLKVIEAMAYRRPVVSTSAGAEGLPICDGNEFFQADQPNEFAAALLKLAEQCTGRDPALEKMLVRARAAVEPLLWPRIVTDLSKSFLELVARSSEQHRSNGPSEGERTASFVARRNETVAPAAGRHGSRRRRAGH
jgi:glycosyltransferase involved in cell wall biosynthesis